MMKHLVNLHGAPLTRRLRRHILYTPEILLPLLFRKEEIAIQLPHSKPTRDIANNSDPRHPEVAGKSGAKHIHGSISFYPRFVDRDSCQLLGNVPF
jgi:hypothetical protein